MAVKIGTRDWSFTPVFNSQRKPAIAHEAKHVVTIDGTMSEVRQLEAAAEAALAIHGRAVNAAAVRADGAGANRPARTPHGRAPAARRR